MSNDVRKNHLRNSSKWVDGSICGLESRVSGSEFILTHDSLTSPISFCEMVCKTERLPSGENLEQSPKFMRPLNDPLELAELFPA